jgi:CBS domain containing-hemolysin-like protein
MEDEKVKRQEEVEKLGNWIYNYLCHLPITTDVVSSNPVHGEVYSIQHYIIKFVSDL